MSNSYFDIISKYEVLSTKEERLLCEDLSKEGIDSNKARERLVLSNLRLVVKIAASYQGRGMELEDLITEGNIGLMKATEKFDIKYKNKFCTYASYWIKHHITRAVEVKGREVRLPTHAIFAATRIFKYRDEHKREHGVEPTISQICKNVKVTKKTAENILNSTGGQVSLDASLLEDSKESFGDIMCEDAKKSPDEIAEFSDDAELLHECLNHLNPKERKVLIHRFGLQNEDGETLEKVGVRLGLTRERIRQIQVEALEKMRRNIFKKI